jgi:hypothetical protein
MSNPDGSIDPTIPTPEQGPLLLGAGTYALYRSPDASIVMVTTDQDGKASHRRIPGALVKIALGGGGLVGQKIRSMLSGGDDEAAAAADELIAGDVVQELPAAPPRRTRKGA